MWNRSLSNYSCFLALTSRRWEKSEVVGSILSKVSGITVHSVLVTKWRENSQEAVQEVPIVSWSVLTTTVKPSCGRCARCSCSRVLQL